MSRRSDCFDNPVIESFFATVKKEADRFPKLLRGEDGGVVRTPRGGLGCETLPSL
jgi:hypothetical protein